MNVLEKEMQVILTELKEKYGVFEIKAEFEAEGSRIEELMRLKDVTSSVGLPIILKIGGVEAVTDMYNGLSLGVKGMIAPMAETAFALSKYLSVIKNLVPQDNAKDIEFAFNLETITGFNNLDSMLALADLKLAAGVTIGRVDLTASMNKDRNYVNSEEIYQITEKVMIKAKERGLKTSMAARSQSSRCHSLNDYAKRECATNLKQEKLFFNVMLCGMAALL